MFTVVSKQDYVHEQRKKSVASITASCKRQGHGTWLLSLQRINYFENYLWKRNTELRSKKVIDKLSAGSNKQNTVHQTNW